MISTVSLHLAIEVGAEVESMQLSGHEVSTGSMSKALRYLWPVQPYFHHVQSYQSFPKKPAPAALLHSPYGFRRFSPTVPLPTLLTLLRGGEAPATPGDGGRLAVAGMSGCLNLRLSLEAKISIALISKTRISVLPDVASSGVAGPVGRRKAALRCCAFCLNILRIDRARLQQ